MRGAGRIGGRAFRPPKPQDGGKGYNPFDLLDIGDLPVAPILTPINDNFSWSIDAEPADPIAPDIQHRHTVVDYLSIRNHLECGQK